MLQPGQHVESAISLPGASGCQFADTRFMLGREWQRKQQFVFNQIKDILLPAGFYAIRLIRRIIQHKVCILKILEQLQP